MADAFWAIKALEDFFQPIIVGMIGASPEADVRIEWPTDGAPGWEIDTDVAFIQLTEQDDPYNKQRNMEIVPHMIGSPAEVDPDNVIEQIKYTRVWSLHLYFYGPNSFDTAQRVRDYFLTPSSFREQLALNRLYPIPSIAAARRVPELFETRWWERSDLHIYLNEDVTRETIVPVIKSVEVNVETEGIIETTNIE